MSATPQDVIRHYLAASGSDVFLLSSSIDDKIADLLIGLLDTKKDKAETVGLFLTTFGGDPDAAYRIARALRRNYKIVRVLIAGPCKSAGTLVALAADELTFSTLGEIGPLDTQISKPDELLSRHSGLDILQSMESVTGSTFDCFESHMLRIIRASSGAISTKVAADIAIQLTTGMVAPITAQIDPVRLGSARRAIDIARAYGIRLAQASRNLKTNSLDKLIDSYPAHGFVIDVEEAKELFNRVQEFSIEENKVFSFFRDLLRTPSEGFVIDLAALLTKSEVSDDTQNGSNEVGQPLGRGTVNPEVHASSDPQDSRSADLPPRSRRKGGGKGDATPQGANGASPIN